MKSQPSISYQPLTEQKQKSERHKIQLNTKYVSVAAIIPLTYTTNEIETEKNMP